ncbi:MAG: NAD(P)/FAD-dependent oxidoreductase [Christensenellaceae bacterium]|nr:NAD(P)/FAD-dependent oxidoreductase [Christensenellaceae bacterium]
MKKTAVIGGGAAGMMAALTASETSEVTIFEKLDRVGRKLAQTGNGRCNISNTAAEAAHYYNNAFVSGIFSRFDVEKTKEFFHSIGLFLKEEYGGRLFPYSDQAGSVVDALRFAVKNRGIELCLSEPVLKIEKNKGIFIVETAKGKRKFDYVIVCCGGAAAEKLGGTMDGYAILKSFGHKITKLRAALAPIKTESAYSKALKGVKIEAKLGLYTKKGCLRESFGDILFTEYGLSGPAVMDVSRYVLGSGSEEICIDLFPMLAEEEVFSMLKRMQKLRETAGELFCGVLNNRLAMTIVKYAGFMPSAAADSLSEKDLENLAASAKNFVFEVKGSMGLAAAQVTRGGAELSGFDPMTLESKIVRGLFAAGEVLDVDGECGGFNLQWAWSSGYVAGKLGG